MREKLPEDMKWVVSKAHIGLYVVSILLCVSLQAARLLSPEYSRQALFASSVQPDRHLYSDGLHPDPDRTGS